MADNVDRELPPRPRHYRATAEVALTLEMAASIVFRPRPRDPEPGLVSEAELIDTCRELAAGEAAEEGDHADR